jgi:hypothetical protein
MRYTQRAKSGELVRVLKKDFSVSFSSLLRNCQTGVFGERGEQWIATQIILLGFIFGNKLPFGWALKLVGTMLLSAGFYLVIASLLALKVLLFSILSLRRKV